MHDFVDNFHLFLTPETKSMLRVGNPNGLDFVPADRLGRTPWPGDSVSAVYPYPTTHISLATKSAGVEGLSWVINLERLENVIRVVHPRVINPKMTESAIRVVQPWVVNR